MKISDIMLNPYNNPSLFQLMQAAHVVQFTNIGINAEKAQTLDIEYFLNRSKDKTVTPLVDFLWEEMKEQYPLASKALISTYVFQHLYKIVYDKFYENWEKIYKSLLADYNPIHNYDMKETEKVNTDTTTTNNSSNDVYGFNSSSATPTDKSNATIHITGSEDSNKRNLTRSGNVGVTSTQRMVTEELKLRETKYFELIYKDIDSLLTLKIYE